MDVARRLSNDRRSSPAIVIAQQSDGTISVELWLPRSLPRTAPVRNLAPLDRDV
jgi:hypothetical protein